MTKAEKCLKWLERALGSMEKEYYGISGYKSEPRVRERVFCYELYHRIKSKYGDKFGKMRLHGELDKRGYDLCCNNIPDFLFHEPGSMGKNQLVVEVKATLKNEGIKKDFETLSKFVSEYKYNMGAFVLINHSLDELKIKFSSFDFTSIDQSDKIYVMCKKSATDDLELKKLSDLLS